MFGLAVAVGLSLAGGTAQPVEFDRRGMHLSFSAGVGDCGPACFFPIGGAGRFEFAYRWKLMSVGGGMLLGGAPYRHEHVPNDSMEQSREGSMRFLAVDAFGMINPLQRGRLDPFFAAGFGYHRFADRHTDGSTAVTFIQAPAFRLSVGVPVFVAHGITIGPRFDQVLPFSGGRCSGERGNPPSGNCDLWSDELEGLSRAERKRVRRERERPWAAMVEFRLAI